MGLPIVSRKAKPVSPSWRARPRRAPTRTVMVLERPGFPEYVGVLARPSVRLHDAQYRSASGVGAVETATVFDEHFYKLGEILGAHALVGLQKHVEVLFDVVVGTHLEEASDALFGPYFVENFFFVFSQLVACLLPVLWIPACTGTTVN